MRERVQNTAWVTWCWRNGFLKKKLWFGIDTGSVPSTAETRTGGGAVLGKPEGSPARRHSCNIDLKKTFAHADIQSNEESNTTHIRSINLMLDLYISLLMLSMWISVYSLFWFLSRLYLVSMYAHIYFIVKVCSYILWWVQCTIFNRGLNVYMSYVLNLCSHGHVYVSLYIFHCVSS